MANKKENKIRLMYMKQLLEKYSDDEHYISTQDIMALMESEYGMPIHRTTVGKDIKEIDAIGVDVVLNNAMEGKRAKQNYYAIGKRHFDINELKLLIDAIISSRFITEKKSNELIEKLKKFASIYQREKLTPNIQAGSVSKSQNEHIFYIMDRINQAITEGLQIEFLYTRYNFDKQLEVTNSEHTHIISPYALVWNNDYYYLVGYSHKYDNITNFRVDRIKTTPTILQQPSRPIPKDFSIERLTKSTFNMYSGEFETVKLKCRNNMMSVIVDHFGMDAHVEKCDDDYFVLTAEVGLSPTFFGWLFGFDPYYIKLVEQQSAVDEYKKKLEKAINNL